MESSPGLHCPRCRSDKYTSLPFGNIVRATGSARTYRCLICAFMFVRRVQRTDAEPIAGDAAEDSGLPGSGTDIPRYSPHWYG